MHAFRPSLEALGDRITPSALVPDGPRAIDPLTGLPVPNAPVVVAGQNVMNAVVLVAVGTAVDYATILPKPS